ncbi:hypothetical protein QTV43_000421 [Vibrio vulnificus]|nr:hypothetical protein [Vibrio vulnificus]
MLSKAENFRKIGNLFALDEASEKKISLDQIYDLMFQKYSFELHDELPSESIVLLAKCNDIEGNKEKLVDALYELDSQDQRKHFITLLSLRPGGLDLIKESELTDEEILYKVSFHCPLCGSETQLMVNAKAISEDYSVKMACRDCGHTTDPNKKCECAHCADNATIFDLVCLLDDGLEHSLTPANEMLLEHIKREEVIISDVDLKQLFANYSSFKNSLSEEARDVATRAIGVYKATGEFKNNTYRFTQNIVGEEKAARVTSELNKVGLFYKKGNIPRLSRTDDRQPCLALESNDLRVIELTDKGHLNIKELGDIEPASSNTSRYIGPEFMNSLSIRYGVAPYLTSVFAINKYILEHEVFGGVISNDIEQNEKLLSGCILTNERIRAVFEEESKKEGQHVFPDIKLGKLVDLSGLQKVLNTATLSLLETYEANLVCFDESYEPIKVYLLKSSSGVDVFKNSVMPLLAMKGVTFEFIDL